MAAAPQRQAITWHIDPNAAPGQLANGDVPLADWVHSGAAAPVKINRFRTVYRVRTAGLDLHVKHCRPVGLRAWLREWLRPAKAVLEYRRICEVARRRVPTLPVVGWGRERRLGPADSFLVTHSLADATPLGDYLTSQQLPPASRQTLARELGRFLAQLHSAGVAHPDLHPGNILLHWADGRPHFVVIDLHDVQLARPLSPAASLANLVLLNRWFVLRSTRADRLRCWMAYAAARPNWAADPRALARELEEQTWRSNRRFWRGRLSRCLRANRYFRRLAGHGVSGYAVADLEPAAIAPLLADPDAPFRTPDRPLLKDSRSSTVAEIDLPIGGNVRRVIYKRFRVTSRWDGVAALLRPTACLRSWINGHSFLDGFLPTPRPLAVWHRRRFGLPADGYLIVEKVDGAADLHGFLQSIQEQPQSDRTAALRRRIDQLARCVRELHRQGWAHRDLKASNLLLTADGAWFIDLVGARRTHVSARLRVRDLARLNASFTSQPLLSRTDRLRFLRTYLVWNLNGRGDWKSWWRGIAARTAAKVRQNARRGRPLA